PMRRTTPSGSASVSPYYALREDGSVSEWTTLARSTRARCGRRTSSGSSSPGGSIPTAFSASASTSSPSCGRAPDSASTSTTDGSPPTPSPGCPRRLRPGTRLGVDEYYGWIFANSVPRLPETAAAEGLTPLEWMRRFGAFEVRRGVGALHEEEVPGDELQDVGV